MMRPRDCARDYCLFVSGTVYTAALAVRTSQRQFILANDRPGLASRTQSFGTGLDMREYFAF